ncbi:MAG: polysaccharide deacetylase [Eubacteriaceae bacterium]|nr:polysaccharide deacetylase [Eubacteriaceae bacterium]
MKINIRQIGIFIVILSACIVIWLAATAATYRSLSQEASPSSSTMSAPTPNTPTPTPVVTPTPAPDRSAFAVTPGNLPGNFTMSDEKIVYLTFDDGPSSKTQAVLDVLDRYGIKATFFVTGLSPDHAPMIKTAYDKGHTIGLHTMSHNYATVYASPEAYFADLDAIGQVVAEQIGYVPCFIRFPGGSSNTISANYTKGIMTTLTAEVNARGYQYYDWGGSVGDGAEKTVDELIAQGTGFGQTNNLILLMHDSETKQNTVDALPAIIGYYLSQGYTFRAIDRDSYVPHHKVLN